VSPGEDRARAADAPESPYVGLDPYSSEDAPFFFGREREQHVIVANLRAARVTLLYGPSGVGKSSVLNAGVVPALDALADELRGATMVDLGDLAARSEAADDQVPS
jgi:ABC-type phosphate transport system ATPase subunit